MSCYTQLNFVINFQFQIQLGKTTDLMSDVKLYAYYCCFTTRKANCFKDMGTGGFFMMKFMFLLTNILLVECVALIFIF